MCPLNSVAFTDSLALATNTTVTIGTIDEIQKLHSRYRWHYYHPHLPPISSIYRTVPLVVSHRRIAYQEVISCRIDIYSKKGLKPSRPYASTQALSTTTTGLGRLVRSGHSVVQAECGQEQELHSLLIMDKHTFKVFHSHQFMQQEYATSIPFYAVVTEFIYPEELEPKTGRIIIFTLADVKLTQGEEKEIKEIKEATYTSLFHSTPLEVGLEIVTTFWLLESENLGRLVSCLEVCCKYGGNTNFHVCKYLQVCGDVELNPGPTRYNANSHH